MKSSGRFSKARGASALPAILCMLGMSAAAADVPAGYKGLPYGGAPRTIPGRVDFEDYDLGGVNVAWKTDNKAGAAGSSAAGREGDGEAQHPGFYFTNSSPAEKDNLPDGTPYPSAENPKSIYIGASHGSDWVNVTVKAEKAGDYWLSSHFASEGTQIKFHVSFNGVNKTGNLALPGTSGYHNWKYYRNFAKVQLDSGTQVMQFYLDLNHLNWDYLSLSMDSSAVTGIGEAGAGRSGSSPSRFRDRSTGVGFGRRKGSALLGIDVPGAGSNRVLDAAGRVRSITEITADP